MADEDRFNLVWMEPGSAQENPFQWRMHDELQTEALSTLIYGDEDEDGVGWVDVVKINNRTEANGWSKEDCKPTMFDGHLRAKLAEEKGERYPAFVFELTQKEEELLMGVFDPIGMMAQTDAEMLERLIERLEPANEALQILLVDLAAEVGIYDEHTTPTFDELDERLGQSEERDFWPYIRIQVSPDIYDLWNDCLEATHHPDSSLAAGDVITIAAKTLVPDYPENADEN